MSAKHDRKDAFAGHQEYREIEGRRQCCGFGQKRIPALEAASAPDEIGKHRQHQSMANFGGDKSWYHRHHKRCRIGGDAFHAAEPRDDDAVALIDGDERQGTGKNRPTKGDLALQDILVGRQPVRALRQDVRDQYGNDGLEKR